METNYRDKAKPITAEDLIRRYKLDDLFKDRKALETNKNGLDKTDTLLKEFVKSTIQDLQTLKNQVDGNIMTWFFDGVPSEDKYPSNEWITETDKSNHLGDLYYDRETGHAYRWTIINNEFVWDKLNDSDISEALALANKALDTADSKRRVFVVEPTPPYDVGDIWLKDDKDLFRCRATRAEGTFNNADWVKATDYSNDDYAKNVEAVLNKFKEEVYKDYATEVKLETTRDSINASVTENTQEIRNIIYNTTDLKNELLSLNEKFNDYVTAEIVTNQINSVLAELTANALKITALAETIENGATKVKTETDFTLDTDGLKIGSNKTKVKNTLDERGMTILDNATQEELLFAGYDTALQETIVKSKNITIEKYLKVPHARYEKYNNQTFGEGTGCFFTD